MDTEEETKEMAAIELPEQAIELSFHPHRDVVASGLVDGKVCLWVEPADRGDVQWFSAVHVN